MRHKAISQLFNDVIDNVLLTGTPDFYHVANSLEGFNATQNVFQDDPTKSIALLIPISNKIPTITGAEIDYSYTLYVLKKFTKNEEKKVSDEGNGTNEDVLDTCELLGLKLLNHFQANAMPLGSQVTEVDVVFVDKVMNERFWGTRYDFTVESMKNCVGGTVIPCADVRIINSDVTYDENAASGVTHTLPDITHTDTDLSPVVLPAQTAMVCSGATQAGIAYKRPQLTGQITSFRTGDDGYNLANGVYDYTPPSTPVSFARLLNFKTLIDNNFFGNKNRFTDINGLQVYGDDYVIDNYTGLGWYRAIFTFVNWNDAIDNAFASTQNSFSDWRIPSISELWGLADMSEASRALDYAPFSETNNNFWISSTTWGQASTSYKTFFNDLVGSISFVAKSTTSTHYICRNHFN